MTGVATSLERTHAAAGMSLAQLQAVAIWLMLATSFYVKFEPALCDAMFIVAVALFMASGLSLTAYVIPLILYLLLYNLGAFLSYLQVIDDSKAMMFVVTSTYMSASAIFFACYIAHDPVRRMAIVKNGWVIGAVLASLLGILGYFNIAGSGGMFSRYDRALSGFKDPNVFGTYLIFPGLMLIQGLLLGNQRHKLISLASLGLIITALFLAFSRGAWVNFVSAAMLMAVFTFVLTPSREMRSRIVFLTIFGALGLVAMLAVLLSFEEVRNLFLDRFTLVKNYDSGETGRFGNQINSIPLLLQRPLGFGPQQFYYYFGLDPHNTFINAFSSYGWLGGVSYFLLITSTIVIGFKTLLIRSPWQNFAIVVFCPLLTTILQGVQIDTDHWRHFYWVLGMMWGLFAASAAHASKAPKPA